MRKFLLLAATPLLFLCACGHSSSDSSSGSSPLLPVTTATKTDSWDYDAAYPIFEVSPDVLSVEIAGEIGGKTLYLVNSNHTESEIPANLVRTVTSEQQPSQSLRSAESASGGTEGGLSEIAAEISAAQDSRKKRRYFSAPRLPGIDGLTRTRAASAAASYSAGRITPVVDTTTKEIFIDTDVNMTISKFRRADATLRAVGTYCYVWVVDDYFDDGSQGESGADANVTSETAAEIGCKFDALYPLVTEVFGEESDTAIDYDALEYIPGGMESYSDTGDRINIVLYDIGADYNLPENEKSGVGGYFYSKDYYFTDKTDWEGSKEFLNYTNKGKYFYVDSAYAASDIGWTISVLAHEFQHMINFGRKFIDSERHLSASSEYDEMLSMLCEDMMQEFLEIDDDDAPRARLSEFNAGYYRSGLSQYNSNAVTTSYAASYALGAWLCRQYGGAALAKAMIENEFIDDKSVVQAVNSLRGTSYSFADIFEQFLLSVTGSGTYTMNQAAEQTVKYTDTDGGTYSYPMTAIDLWSDTYSTESLRGSTTGSAYSGYSFRGPFLFSTSCRMTLMPEYGFTLHGVEETAAGQTSLTVTLSEKGSSSLTVYLIIQ